MTDDNKHSPLSIVLAAIFIVVMIIAAADLLDALVK